MWSQYLCKRKLKFDGPHEFYTDKVLPMANAAAAARLKMCRVFFAPHANAPYHHHHSTQLRLDSSRQTVCFSNG